MNKKNKKYIIIVIAINIYKIRIKNIKIIKLLKNKIFLLLKYYHLKICKKISIYIFKNYYLLNYFFKKKKKLLKIVFN